MLSNHLILWNPLLLLSSIFPSIRVFSNELALCLRWPKYWHFCISLSNEYSGLISFRIDWFDLLAVWGILKSLLQHVNSKAGWLFTSGGQSIGASISVLPINIQGWFLLGLTGLISLQSKGLSRVFCSTTIQKLINWISYFYINVYYSAIDRTKSHKQLKRTLWGEVVRWMIFPL